MTANQINYAKYREEVRSNLENEAIKRRANDLTDAANLIASINAATNARNVEVNAYNAQSSRMQAESSMRQAAAREREVEQNYLLESARQAETTRHNQQLESEQAAQRLSNERNVDVQSATSQRNTDVTTDTQIHNTSQINRTNIVTSLINTVGGFVRSVGSLLK